LLVNRWPSLAWLRVFNPFTVVDDLAVGAGLGPAWASAGLWLGVGLLGVVVASWRLRPSCLRPMEGERAGRKPKRRLVVPPVDERRPMLWKELYIEHVATLGKFGNWAGRILVLSLIAGSLGLAAVFCWDAYRGGDAVWAGWARDELEYWVGRSGDFLSMLIQWAIGLRAAVSISSERERGTWDAILTSPMEGSELAWGKLWGSLHAIGWLIVAALLAWTVAVAVEAVPLRQGVVWAAEVFVIGAFMAAVGVRTSLVCATATRAMAVTIGVWLGAYVGFAMLTLLVLASGLLLCNLYWVAAAQLGLAPPVTTLWAPVPFSIGFPAARMLLYLSTTVLTVIDTRLRFDRLAGRMTAGKLATAFDRFLYGVATSQGIGADFGPDGPTPPPESDQPQRREDAVAGPA
jgi:hypothetical protein